MAGGCGGGLSVILVVDIDPRSVKLICESGEGRPGDLRRVVAICLVVGPASVAPGVGLYI